MTKARSNTPQLVQQVAVKAVVVNAAGEVLLLREAKTAAEGTQVGRYQATGGRLHPGEKLFDGLAREVFEETGLQIEPGQPVLTGEWFPVINGQPTQIVAIFYLCRCQNAAVQLSSEHDHFVWARPHQLDEFDIISPDNEAIRQGLALLARE